ncbi:MAG: haloacid dehalogenase type II [Acidobacteriota bacterium]
MRPFRLITFDVYTALVDLESSLLGPLNRALETLGPSTDTAALLQSWRRTQMAYVLISNSLPGGHIRFYDITRRALDHCLHHFHLDLPAEDRRRLTDAWSRLEPWPEARPVLSALAARDYPLALLSNGDEAMLRAMLAHIDMAFEHVFAGDQAGAYKPDPAIYRLPLERLGLSATEVLHVAGSATDTLGAKAAGLRCAWSNRDGDVLLDPAYGPDFEFSDLTGLLEILPPRGVEN